MSCTSDSIKPDGLLINSSSPASSQYDEKAVNCQYSMANAFVKSILQWESQIPREEFQDISDIIVKRLENILEYPVIDDGDRVTQQIKFLSDIIASWIAGVLFDVAEAHKEELEKECEERKNANFDDSDEESDDNDSEDEVVIEPRPQVLANLKQKKEPKKDEDNDKDKKEHQSGDSYNKIKVKDEPKSDDDEDDELGGGKGVQGGTGSSGKTATDSEQNETGVKSESVEDQTSGETKEEEEQKDDELKTLSKKGEFTDTSKEALMVREMTDESSIVDNSDSILEIPQEPKVYETIIIDDESDSEKNKMSARLEPGNPIKSEKFDESVKEELGLLKTSISKIKIEKDENIVDMTTEIIKTRSGLEEEPLFSQIKSEKINEELPESVNQRIKREPGLEGPTLSQIKLEKIQKELSESVSHEIKQENGSDRSPLIQIKSEKIKEELAESVVQEIKQESGLEKSKLSQIKPEKIKKELSESMSDEIKQENGSNGLSVSPETIKYEKIKDELTESFTQGIKLEPGLERLSLSQIKPEKIKKELSESIGDEIKKENESNGLSVSLESIKYEKVEDELIESFTQEIKLEPGLERLSLFKIKSEKIDDESPDILIQNIKTELDLPAPIASQIKAENNQKSVEEATVLNIKSEKLGEELDKHNAVIKIESGILKLSESKIKTEKVKNESNGLPIDPIKSKKVEEILQKNLLSKKIEDEIKREKFQDPLRISADTKNKKQKDEKKIPIFKEFISDKKDDKLQPIADFAKIFETDVPFINFLKLFDTFENLIQKEKENYGDDPTTDRLHRAIYKKFENIVNAETPDKLTEHLKDMLDVLSGKIAIFLRHLLTETEISFLENSPAQVESFELRETGKWMGNILSMANSWSSWLQTVVEEAVEISTHPTTRNDWHDWTKKVQDEALLFHKYHLKYLHQAHHNRMMLSRREVVKTGELNYPEYEIKEREIKTTDLWD